MGGLLRHYAFHLAVVLTGGGVVALRRHMEPGAWMVLVAVYVSAVLVGVAVLIRRERTEPNAASDVVAELDALPVGIEVEHVPTRVAAPQGGPAARGDWPYRWFFKTSVRALNGPLTVTAFGVLGWDGRRWVASPGREGLNAGTMTADEFADWYGCPGGRLQPGTPAVDPSNWAGSNTPHAFRQKWFYVGVDSAGRRLKGEAVVELLAPEGPVA